MAVLKTVRYSYFQPDCIKLLSSTVCTFSFRSCFLHASAEEQGVYWQQSPDVMQMVRASRVHLEKRSSLWLSVASSVPVAWVLLLWADRKLLVFLLHGWVAAEGHMCSLSRMNISQNFLLLSHLWHCDNLKFFWGKKTTTWKWWWGFEKIYFPSYTYLLRGEIISYQDENICCRRF